MLVRAVPANDAVSPGSLPSVLRIGQPVTYQSTDGYPATLVSERRLSSLKGERSGAALLRRTGDRRTSLLSLERVPLQSTYDAASRQAP